VLEVVAVHATLWILATGAFADDERPVRVRGTDVLVDADERLTTRTVGRLAAPVAAIVIVTVPTASTVPIRERRGGSSEHYREQRERDAGA
jgi:nitrogen fixation-related uncharacterized protein